MSYTSKLQRIRRLTSFHIAKCTASTMNRNYPEDPVAKWVKLSCPHLISIDNSFRCKVLLLKMSIHEIIDNETFLTNVRDSLRLVFDTAALF